MLKKIILLPVIVFAFSQCAGPSSERSGQINKEEISVIILPFSYPGGRLQNALDGPAIIEQAFQIAFRQRGFSMAGESSEPISLPSEVTEGPVGDDLAARVAVLAGVDIVIYGDIIAFGEDLGRGKTINFVAKAYSKRENLVILRERLSEKYVQENPVTIINQMALDYVRLLEDTGQL